MNLFSLTALDAGIISDSSHGSLTVSVPQLIIFLAFAYHAPRHHRHTSGWSYRQVAAASFLKTFLRNFAFLRIKWPISLKPRCESTRFVVMNPAPADLYTGVAIDADIQPARIGGTWYPEPYNPPSPTFQSSSPEEDQIKHQHIILHFHGGSYILGDGRTSSCGFLAKSFLENTPASHVLCPQYRLATHKGGRFPAQLQDAITSYMYLIRDLQIPASRIVLSGDSSGAHLALALLRYILDHGYEFASKDKGRGQDTGLGIDIPTPKCAWAWSPWCDVPGAVDAQGWTHSENYKTEYIPGSFPAWGARRFLGDLEITEERERYLAPLRWPFRVPCPVLVGTGNREVLFHEHVRLVEVLGERRGGDGDPPVEIVVADKVPHDVFMIAWIMGFKAEARVCARKAGEFVDRIGGGVKL
ncbi:alpha/beta hydrolase [Aspergillus affinis]|uniref:alpha/beta hydrolase n=1 Tax=Aspergillus affinis TaxID=1070780 RepID=UPI0022FDD9B9|nr:alpha/beta-hydrolase [Aspergillus affinis]KAI9036887.1 alpha/beta-hydrolase [Aspergillus affinis]